VRPEPDHSIDGATVPAFTAPTNLRIVTATDTNRAGPAGARVLRLNHFSSAPFTVVITACGEIDASNVCELVAYLRDDVGPYRSLVLDLRGVNFFGLAGLSALEVMGQADPSPSQMAILPSPAVVRLLRLCTTGASIPIFDDIAAALVAVQTERPVLKLIPDRTGHRPPPESNPLDSVGYSTK
jgi:anti-anti-sigma factor